MLNLTGKNIVFMSKANRKALKGRLEVRLNNSTLANKDRSTLENTLWFVNLTLHKDYINHN
jgi:hypothetical protein